MLTRSSHSSQYMATLRMQQDNLGEKEEEEEEEAEEEDEDEDEDEEDDDDDGQANQAEELDDGEVEARLQDGSLLPPSLVDPAGRGHGRQSRRTKEGGVKPPKASRDFDVKDKIAAERQRKATREAKHHGKKAHAGKTGRAWAPGAGGKAQTSNQALVFNSLHF